MNTHSLSAIIFAGFAVLLGTACQTATQQDVESLGQKSEALGLPGYYDYTTTRVIGRIYDLAGRDLNGVSLNGKVLDGHLVVSVGLSSAKVQGVTAREVSLDGSVFTGRSGSGKALKAEQWVGAEFTALLDDGESIALRIDERVVSKERSERDVVRYVVSYPTLEGRSSLCGEDQNGNPIAAIPLQGRWNYEAGAAGGGDKIDDPTVFTFACDGFVLAKCVHMGYHPWWPVMICTKGHGCEKSTLSAHHQACTRMLRADYCGNGLSHTVDGTAVNAYDGIGVRSDGEAWNLEAEWTASGARCAAVERISEPNQPSCWPQLESATCGDPANFGSGTLIMSEVEPAQQ